MLGRPTHMPAARRRIVSYLEWAGPQASKPEVVTMLERVKNAIQLAELFWVTRDMTAAALDGSTDLPDDTALGAHLPTSHGLLVYESGVLPPLPALQRFEQAGVSALSWSVIGPEVRIVAWSWMESVRSILVLPEGRRQDEAPDMLPVETITMPLDADDGWGVLEEYQRAVVALLVTTWIMMMTPTVAETQQWTERRSNAGSVRRPPAMVTTIQLRRLARRPVDEEHGESGRVYTHQWVVRGHWRQQPYGPQRSQRRTTWVPSYIKGPEGAPLLAREHVHVWRR